MRERAKQRNDICRHGPSFRTDTLTNKQPAGVRFPVKESAIGGTKFAKSSSKLTPMYREVVRPHKSDECRSLPPRVVCEKSMAHERASSSGREANMFNSDAEELEDGAGRHASSDTHAKVEDADSELVHTLEDIRTLLNRAPGVSLPPEMEALLERG